MSVAAPAISDGGSGLQYPLLQRFGSHTQGLLFAFDEHDMALRDGLCQLDASDAVPLPQKILRHNCDKLVIFSAIQDQIHSDTCIMGNFV